MEAYQQRVVDEKDELDGKVAKLRLYLKTGNYFGLSRDEQGRMLRQYLLMREYSDVLGERIVAWTTD